MPVKPPAHPLQVARYIEVFGSIEEALGFLETREDMVYKTIRANTLRISREELAERLRTKGVITRPYEPTPYGLIVEQTPVSIGALHEYMQGYYTVQGPASMLAVIALKPEEAHTAILDCCAGAGGKSTQIAQHAPRKPVIAVDTSTRKLRALKNHLSRLGVTNVIAINTDARKLSTIWPPGLEKPSHILVDAPCSGEGLWPFPRGRWPRTRRDIVSRVRLQAEIMLSLLSFAEPGTIIVYSTCSISVEENEYLLNEVMEAVKAELVVEEPSIPGDKGITEYLGLRLDESLSGCRRLYPHKHHTEGFTICRLRLVERARKASKSWKTTSSA